MSAIITDNIFVDTRDNIVNIILLPLTLELRGNNPIFIPYNKISAIIVDGNIMTLTLLSPLDVQLGTVTSLNLRVNDIKFAGLIASKNPQITIHQLNEFDYDIPIDISKLLISQVQLDTYPSSRFNLNVKYLITPDGIKFTNSRGFELMIPSANISRYDIVNGSVYLTLVTSMPLSEVEQPYLVFSVTGSDTFSRELSRILGK